MKSKKEHLEHLLILIERKAKDSPEVKSFLKTEGDDFSVDWKKVAKCQHEKHTRGFRSGQTGSP